MLHTVRALACGNGAVEGKIVCAQIIIIELCLSKCRGGAQIFGDSQLPFLFFQEPREKWIKPAIILPVELCRCWVNSYRDLKSVFFESNPLVKDCSGRQTEKPG